MRTSATPVRPPVTPPHPAHPDTLRVGVGVPGGNEGLLEDSSRTVNEKSPKAAGGPGGTWQEGVGGGRGENKGRGGRDGADVG